MTAGGTRCRGITRRWTVGAATTTAALAAIALFVPGVQPPAGASSGTTCVAGAPASQLAGCQGVVAPLPATSSSVTASGRGAFSNLKVTVNQTADLVNQDISVSWTGAAATAATPGDAKFQQNYLQIFQCWGDPDPSDPLTAADPGPSPTQCEFGGQSSNDPNAYPVVSSGNEYTRTLSLPGWSNFSQVGGWTDPSTGTKIEPFDAVDGTEVDQQLDPLFQTDGKPFWLNPYFSYSTTNEVDFARTNATPDGTGAGQKLFQVDTGLEAPGLGCGQSVQATTGGGDKAPQCWLVVVPRGTPTQENPPGTETQDVTTSPLTPTAWANRIAIPLRFQPVGTGCSIGGNQERIVGSELATAASSSWENALCGTPGTPPFSYDSTNDDQARQNLIQASYGSAGLSVFTDPISPAKANPSNPIVYAPLTLSGVTVAFTIDRVPIADQSTNFQSQPDEIPLNDTQVEHLNLTPRLVAKLLTESYQAELKQVTFATPTGYAWVLKNPVSLLTDPDFLQYNPEFSLLSNTQPIDSSTLVVEESSSDAASALWNWVLNDPAARAWLGGQPDPWGMQVNPLYSTNASANPTGTPFGSPTPNNFPKSDPYCYQTGDTVGVPPQPAPPLCLLNWSPYALTMQAAAQSTASANDGAKTSPGNSVDNPWTANGPQTTGSQFVMSVTDTASASQYGLETASLSRSGDDGASPAFVAPDQQSILAGEQAMVPSAVSGVLQADPAATATDAYPLPMLTYAAATPLSLDVPSRQAYAAFIRYAVGAGQTQGVAPGDLPNGYVPLPSALQQVSDAAAASIANPPTPPSTTTTTAPATAAPVSSSSPLASSYAGGPSGSSTGTAISERSSPTGSAAAPRKMTVVATTTRTVDYRTGALRWSLWIVLGLGIAAALCEASLGNLRRKRKSTVPVPDDVGPTGPGPEGSVSP